MTSHYILSESDLRAAMPHATDDNIARYISSLRAAMLQYEINSPKRAAMFIAQLAHESGSLKYDEEIWTNSDAQQRYEPPSKTASRLGNIEQGDGYRFRGRGLIQLTGRYNYKLYGFYLNEPLEAEPDCAKAPQVSCNIAGAYFLRNKLNKLADRYDVRTTTLRINGGLNGLEQRERHYETALQAFGVEPKRSVQ
jgi:putative chitinase